MIFHCPHCGLKAVPGKRDCGACGKTMTRGCAGCGEQIAADAKACKYCGADPGAVAVPAPAAPVRRPRRRGRKLLLAVLVLAALTGAAAFVAAGRPASRTPKPAASPTQAW